MENKPDLSKMSTEEKRLALAAILKGSAKPEQVDLVGEAVLPKEISIEALPAYVPKMDKIFLTGATGFVGGFLLAELLATTKGEVYCLVRASNVEEAFSKINANLNLYSMEGLPLERVKVILGNLANPHFGLTDEEFKSLASEMDIIYHAGASTNWVRPYSELKSTNVLGAIEILKLATTTKVKPIHFTSTTLVFPSTEDMKVVKPVLEGDVVESPHGIFGGYPQTKWVTENLFTQAINRQIPVCMYRIGMVSGHSQTGACNIADFLCRMLIGSIQAGSVPKIVASMDWAPIDYVVQGMVYISKQPELLGKIFHLVNPNPINWADSARIVQSLGYDVEVTAYSQWQQNLENSPNNPLRPLLPLISNQAIFERRMKMPIFDCHDAVSVLSPINIHCLSIPEILKYSLSYFSTKGYIKPKA